MINPKLVHILREFYVSRKDGEGRTVKPGELAEIPASIFNTLAADGYVKEIEVKQPAEPVAPEKIQEPAKDEEPAPEPQTLAAPPKEAPKKPQTLSAPPPSGRRAPPTLSRGK